MADDMNNVTFPMRPRDKKKYFVARGDTNKSEFPSSKKKELLVSKSIREQDLTLENSANFDDIPGHWEYNSPYGKLSSVRSDDESNDYGFKPRKGPDGAIIPYAILGSVEDYLRLAGASPEASNGTLDLVEQERSDSPPPQSAASAQVVVPAVPTSGMSKDEYLLEVRKVARKEALKRRIASEAREDIVKSEKLRGMLSHERLMVDKEARIMQRHEDHKQEWDTFKKKLLISVGKSSGQDLVFFRGPQYRRNLEDQLLRQKALPAEKYTSTESWVMNLRGTGTRYIAVGNIFSGLFCPVKESTNAPIEIIRNAVGPEDAPSHRSECRQFCYMHKVNNKLGKLLAEEDPKPLFDEDAKALTICGEPLLEWAYVSVQKRAFEAAEQTNLRITSEANIAAEPEEEVDIQKIGPQCEIVSLQSSNETLSDSSGVVSLVLSSTVGEKTKGMVKCKNTGDTVLYYNLTQEHYTPRKNDTNVSPFTCVGESGVIQPGSSTDIVFSFNSIIPGSWSQEWILNTKPTTRTFQIVLSGMSSQQDHGLVARTNARDELAREISSMSLDAIVENLLTVVSSTEDAAADPEPNDNESTSSLTPEADNDETQADTTESVLNESLDKDHIPKEEAAAVCEDSVTTDEDNAIQQDPSLHGNVNDNKPQPTHDESATVQEENTTNHEAETQDEIRDPVLVEAESKFIDVNKALGLFFTDNTFQSITELAHDVFKAAMSINEKPSEESPSMEAVMQMWYSNPSLVCLREEILGLRKGGDYIQPVDRCLTARSEAGSQAPENTDTNSYLSQEKARYTKMSSDFDERLHQLCREMLCPPKQKSPIWQSTRKFVRELVDIVVDNATDESHDEGKENEENTGDEVSQEQGDQDCSPPKWRGALDLYTEELNRLEHPRKPFMAQQPYPETSFEVSSGKRILLPLSMGNLLALEEDGAGTRAWKELVLQKTIANIQELLENHPKVIGLVCVGASGDTRSAEELASAIGYGVGQEVTFVDESNIGELNSLTSSDSTEEQEEDDTENHVAIVVIENTNLLSESGMETMRSHFDVTMVDSIGSMNNSLVSSSEVVLTGKQYQNDVKVLESLSNSRFDIILGTDDTDCSTFVELLKKLVTDVRVRNVVLRGALSDEMKNAISEYGDVSYRFACGSSEPDEIQLPASSSSINNEIAPADTTPLRTDLRDILEIAQNEGITLFWGLKSEHWPFLLQDASTLVVFDNCREDERDLSSFVDSLQELIADGTRVICTTEDIVGVASQRQSEMADEESAIASDNTNTTSRSIEFIYEKNMLLHACST